MSGFVLTGPGWLENAPRDSGGPGVEGLAHTTDFAAALGAQGWTVTGLDSPYAGPTLGAGGWTVPVIPPLTTKSALQLWLDATFAEGVPGIALAPSPTTCFADVGRTVPSVVGGPVLSATDLSGNANHATFTNVTLEQDAGGHYYLLANGTSSSGTTPTIDLTGTQKATFITAIRKASDAAIGVFAEHGIAGDANLATLLQAPRTATAPGYGATIFGGGLNSQVSVANVAYAAPVTNVASVALDYAGATIALQIKIRLNGAVFTNVPGGTGPVIGNFGNYALNIFRRGGSGSLYFNGWLYVLVFIGASQSDEQVAEATAILNALSGAY